jgi:hypothetical protein
MIHADIFEFELNFDTIISEIIREFNELISKVLNELIINIRDPGLQSDGYILE